MSVRVSRAALNNVKFISGEQGVKLVIPFPAQHPPVPVCDLERYETLEEVSLRAHLIIKSSGVV